MARQTKADLTKTIDTLTRERDHLAAEVYRLTAALAETNAPAPAEATAPAPAEEKLPGQLVDGVRCLGSAYVTWRSGKQTWCRIVELSPPKPGSGWHEGWRVCLANWKAPSGEFRQWKNLSDPGLDQLRLYKGCKPEGWPE